VLPGDNEHQRSCNAVLSGLLFKTQAPYGEVILFDERKRMAQHSNLTLGEISALLYEPLKKEEENMVERRFKCDRCGEFVEGEHWLNPQRILVGKTESLSEGQTFDACDSCAAEWHNLLCMQKMAQEDWFNKREVCQPV